MSNREQELKDLKEKYDLLIQTVHKMNDLVHHGKSILGRQKKKKNKKNLTTTLVLL